MRKFVMGLVPLLLLGSAVIAQADDASDKQAFRDFLAQAKTAASPDADKTAAFYKTTGAYWRAHWLDYSQHPENYAEVMGLYKANQAIYHRKNERKSAEELYRKEIDGFEEYEAKNTLPKNPAIFVGSSTPRRWKTAEAFPEFNIINRAIGGSVIGDVQYFYKETIGKYHPSAILFYCDNDVTGGADGSVAFQKTMDVYARVRADFPKVPFVFLSMKHAPNSAFADLGEPANIDKFNDLAKAQAKKDPLFKYFDMDAGVLDAKGHVRPELFFDGEHFNDNGYALVNPLMKKMLASLHVTRAK